MQVGTIFLKNKGYFRVKDNCMERESRGEEMVLEKTLPFLQPSIVPIINDACKRRGPSLQRSECTGVTKGHSCFPHSQLPCGDWISV